MHVIPLYPHIIYEFIHTCINIQLKAEHKDNISQLCTHIQYTHKIKVILKINIELLHQ